MWNTTTAKILLAVNVVVAGAIIVTYGYPSFIGVAVGISLVGCAMKVWE